MNRDALEFNQNMPALLNEWMAGDSLEFFMAALLQDQRIIRGDEDVIVVPDNAKPPSKNASQFPCDGSQISFTEGMGGFASPKRTQSRSSGSSSIHKDAPLTPTSRWDSSSPKVPKRDGLTPPRRLPEHIDSFRIHRQKYPRRGGFILQPQNGLIAGGRDEPNVKTSSQDIEEDHSKNTDDMADIVQALREIDAERNSQSRDRFALPSSLQRLPYDLNGDE